LRIIVGLWIRLIHMSVSKLFWYRYVRNGFSK